MIGLKRKFLWFLSPGSIRHAWQSYANIAKGGQDYRSSDQNDRKRSDEV